MVEFKPEPEKPEQLTKILHPLVARWFFSKFKEFSLPQLYGVMEIHKRNNVLISAPTGATKTLTGFLSIINELVDSAEKGILQNKVYAVYISPLKALNYDIEINLKQPLKEIEELSGKPLGIRVATRTGDTTAYEKQKMLKNPPHIFITTPESLAIILNSPKFKEKFSSVDWMIIDEIHSLAENKRGVHLSITMERLQRLSPGLCRVGLSATVAPLEEIAKFLVGFEKKKSRPCQIIDVQFIKETDFEVLSPVPDLIDVNFKNKQDAMYNLVHNLVQKHKTTLIFTNTRAATERVVHTLRQRFPKTYIENIGAHHSSLGKTHRQKVEQDLRDGKLKVVVSSTSLELGIDIGYIDLVICLGSPKSVSRFLQRAGRAGHQLHSRVKARIIVLDRDDLVECSILLKSAIQKKIDRVHIPTNALDVLAQKIYGIAIAEKIDVDELFDMIKKSYCYHKLDKKDFYALLKYLTGAYATLEDRHVYAKIWWDEETNMIGKKGKLARVIYMTNIGTIPDESFVTVKIRDQVIGFIDEGFLERLKPGDVFVLGGSAYQFRFSRGMIAQVGAAHHRKPTVPRWASEMLPLSFDLAVNIGRFRRLIAQKINKRESKSEILKVIKKETPVDSSAANSIYCYIKEQHAYATVPNDKKILIEHYKDKDKTYVIFHALFGRRVNDCLSRGIAYVLGKQQNRDVEVGINDTGFYLASNQPLNPLKAFKALHPNQLRTILEHAIEKSEILSRRFRHCATRALMILRNYKGKKKRVGRQQVSSKILFHAVKRIDSNFTILQEARREVLEDLMDFDNTRYVIEQVANKQIKVEEIFTQFPSPFAFNLITQGFSDLIKIEDRDVFLKRMHKMILAKISLKHKEVDYEDLWRKAEEYRAQLTDEIN